MKKILINIFFLLCCCSISAHTINELVKVLDSDIKNRDIYYHKKQLRIDKLKQLQAVTSVDLINKYQSLFDEYYNYRIDSALYYAGEIRNSAIAYNNKEWYQLSQIDHAKYFSAVCMYMESANILLSMRKNIYPSLREKFYDALSQYYVWLTEYTPNKQYKQKYKQCAYIYTDSLITYRSSTSIYKCLSLAECYRSSDLNKSINILLPIIDTIKFDNSDLRLVSCNLAETYQMKHDVDSAKYYYTLAAISDIRNGVKEHTALHKLSLILINEGDVERAYNYLNCCIEDAQFCNARLRTMEAVPDFTKIYEAYQKKISKSRSFMEYSIISLILLLLGLLVALGLLYKINKKLDLARVKVVNSNQSLELLNDKMKTTIDAQKSTNVALKESNRIKETYIVQYMKNCISYIDKLDLYRHSLNKLAINNNTDKLFMELKSTKYIENELKNFYKEFDSTFLLLFPNFVEDFNKLLNENERINAPQYSLTPELRIFALIRLGITDSNDIASFLQYSVKTIYNYRVKVRNKAKNNRNNLEEELKHIGAGIEL